MAEIIYWMGKAPKVRKNIDGGVNPRNRFIIKTKPWKGDSLYLCRPFRTPYLAQHLPGVYTPVCVLSHLRRFPHPIYNFCHFRYFCGTNYHIAGNFLTEISDILSFDRNFRKLPTYLHNRGLHIDIPLVTLCRLPTFLKAFRHFTDFDLKHLCFQASWNPLTGGLTWYGTSKQVVSTAKQLVSIVETNCFPVGMLNETGSQSAY